MKISKAKADLFKCATKGDSNEVMNALEAWFSKYILKVGITTSESKEEVKYLQKFEEPSEVERIRDIRRDGDVRRLASDILDKGYFAISAEAGRGFIGRTERIELFILNLKEGEA